MQKSINQSFENRKNPGATSERGVLLLLFLLGLAGILYLFTRSTHPDLRDLTQTGRGGEKTAIQSVAVIPRR